MGKPPRGLGRGLDVLMPVRKEPVATSSGQSYGKGNVFECPLEKIVPQKGQPRQHFDKEKLDELAQSLREHGLLEPLVVRRRGEEFELIAGERRWRAAQRAGLREVLVVVRDVSGKDAFELALIENIQREDLNAVEFAEAMQRLLDEHGYTQETLADRVGKDRSTIANALRLLKLPEKIRRLVVNGELSEGHARALLGAKDEKTLEALAEKVASGRMSVRQTEALVRAAKPANGAAPAKAKGKTPAVKDLEARLTRKLGTRCEVRDRDGKGELAIAYSSLDELDRLLESLL
ncbi:MAG TPA: ParB/RepB/Spo0J family partition protein [Polyangiaceae bacterium]|jgi:ParB family chromosome partitioning protein|nr:ParB/RepB/Spo0J family partition protein [Polyangiaceae bacterium]